MTWPPELADAISSAGVELLTPPVRTAAPPAVDGPLRVCAGLDLGHGRWLCVVGDRSGRRWTAPVVADGASVRRARTGDGVAAAVVDCVVGAVRVAPPFVVQAVVGRRVAGERAVTVDQTNESVVVGESAVVKLCLHLPARGNKSPPPAARRLPALTAAGFEGMPPLWGMLSVEGGDEPPLLLASVTGYLPGAVDGWHWATDDARKYATGELDEAAIAPAATLGALTARMHVALSSAGRERATSADTQRWLASAHRDLRAAVAEVDGPEGDRLAVLAPRAAAGLAALGASEGTALIEVHGDLHVGQVLRHSSPPRFAVTDFDGSPVVAAGDRDRRQPAAVDVAGMIASLDHVGRVVLRRTSPIDRGRVLTWVDQAQRSFLRSYLAGLSSADAQDLFDDRLLRPLRVWQECREFLYAARHLPHWRYVPDQALASLLGAAP
jgi:maltokinase